MFRRGLLRTGGALVYLGAPIAVASTYWELFTVSDGGTKLSFIALFIMICSTPVLGRALRGIRAKINVNWIWVILLGVTLLLERIIEPLKYISIAGVAGSFTGYAMFNVADRMKETTANEKQADLVAEKMLEKKNV